MDDLTKYFVDRGFLSINIHTGEPEITEDFPKEVEIDHNGDVVYNTFRQKNWKDYGTVYANFSSLPIKEVDRILNQLK